MPGDRRVGSSDPSELAQLLSLLAMPTFFNTLILLCFEQLHTTETHEHNKADGIGAHSDL